MGKRRRAQPVVAVVKSRKRARQIVTAFHKTEAELTALAQQQEEEEEEEEEEEDHDDDEEEEAEAEAKGGRDPRAKAERMKELQRSLEQLGGRAAYQAASQLSVSFFNTSKWVMARLVEMGLKPKKGEPPLRVLEVGAINTTLLDCPWLDVTAIDLLARHERIQQQDFFTLPQTLRFAAISNSMVLNSVPTPRSRGEMLRQCHHYLRHDRGHLFLMLPRSCLTHSQWLTLDGFRRRVVPHYGFRIVREHATPKVAFFVLQAVEPEKVAVEQSKGNGAAEGRPLLPAASRASSSSWAKDFAIDLV